MATTRLLLGLICFAFTGSFSMFNSDLLAPDRLIKVHDTVLEAQYRLKLVSIARNEIGVRELTNQNDGKRVETYLSLVHLHRGDPYCASFLSWVFSQAGFAKPRAGWCPDLFPGSRITRSALPGDIAGIYFPELKRVAHVGMVEKIDDEWCVTIEANTNISGSREGEGVYRKRRRLKTIYRMANWVSPERRLP